MTKTHSAVAAAVLCATAGLIALSIPELPRYKGEQIAPGITRIRGNLCNVHGKYGPCDKGMSGKPKKGTGARKPAKGRQPRQTPAQRAQARQGDRDQNIADVAKRMAESDTGLAPGGTGVSGHSNQSFVTVADLDKAEDEAVTISIRLVGPDDSPRPLKAVDRANPVPNSV